MLEPTAEPSTEIKFCVFIVYDDNDDWARKNLLQLLDDKKITYCCLDTESNPGLSIIRNFQYLLTLSRKVLFVISPEFCKNTLRQYMVDIVIETHAKERIITLITESNIVLSCKNGLLSLKCTKSIHKDSENWRDSLVQEVKFETPDYCQLLRTASVSNLLYLRGLCFQTFQSEVFGFSILIGEKYFQVDLREFSKHLKVHQECQTIETCRQCRSLYNADSFVSIVINTNVTLVEHVDELIITFGQLCQYVFDALSLCSTFSPAFTVSGPFLPSEQTFVTKLYHEVYFALGYEFQRRLCTPWAPKYEDFEKRVESFKAAWQGPSAEIMAKAGYYFYEKPDWTRCFFCGFGHSLWEKDDDPFMVHAKYLPTCRFLQQHIQTEGIRHQGIGDLFVPVERYKCLHSRKESFDNFPGSETLENKEDVFFKLANSGFFYKGADFEVMCFACGVSIFYHDNTIDPWVFHAEYSSNCPYLLGAKADHTLIKIIERKKLQDEPTIVNVFLKKHDGCHRREISNVFKPCKRLPPT
ncbi:hypothetical protein ACJMK2_004514 [Sinanodonta woodiana]|uniref:TIR domain-containing protein n=1 Tax=Sinanodonta woodiana TaxID=1069815 RepID=A0ABD3Y3D9_SINWO